MMKRPMHVWGVFVVCLVVAIAGMVWLSVSVTELERAEATRASTKVNFEANVRLALRRMDNYIDQMLSEQSAWPYVAYQPSLTLPVPGKEPAVVVPSPLRVSSSPLVKLYFQVTPAMTYTSPGVPMRGSKPADGPQGLSADQMADNTKMLADLSQMVEPSMLLGQCAAPKPLTEESIAALAAPKSNWLAPPLNWDVDPFNAASAVQQQAAANPAPPQAAGKIVSQAATPPPQQAVKTPPPQAAGIAVPQYASSGDRNRRDAQEFNTLKSRYQTQNDSRIAQTQLREQFGYGNVYSPEPQPKPKPSGGGNVPRATVPPAIVEGIARPLWMGQELLLARRVNVGDQTVIQGCWFDWQTVKQALRAEVADLLSNIDIDIVPVNDESLEDPARMLAALSAKVIAHAPPLAASATKLMTPVRLAMLAAWIALAAAAVAAAVLLRGVMALSERRAAFVSAVTHELRTPLTTFRMYSEMLAEGMVPDESKRRHYLGTLKNEADRLFHLIENVLSYARLERGRRTATRNDAHVEDLLTPIVRRLSERSARDGMELDFMLDPAVKESTICTDAGALEQILVNLVDNACKYAAAATDRRIHIDVARQRESLVIRVSDHGPGIAPAEARALFRPFTKSASQAAQTAPGVGLGLALSQRLARDLGGSLELSPAADQPAAGAVFRLTLPLR